MQENINKLIYIINAYITKLLLLCGLIFITIGMHSYKLGGIGFVVYILAYMVEEFDFEQGDKNKAWVGWFNKACYLTTAVIISMGIYNYALM